MLVECLDSCTQRFAEQPEFFISTQAKVAQVPLVPLLFQRVSVVDVEFAS